MPNIHASIKEAKQKFVGMLWFPAGQKPVSPEQIEEINADTFKNELLPRLIADTKISAYIKSKLKKQKDATRYFKLKVNKSKHLIIVEVVEDGFTCMVLLNHKGLMWI